MQYTIFKNHYFALRHGESVANTQGIILSHPEEGKKEAYTLTERGEAQVSASVMAAKKKGLLDDSAIIYSSPFSRCRKTAEIAKDRLDVAEAIVVDDRLRERWFGDFEGTSNVNYKNVWDRDASDPEHNDINVETTSDVARRVVALVHDLENNYSDKTILLVSHGDTLQILQTFFNSALPSAHREMEPLQVAEIRALN